MRRQEKKRKKRLVPAAITGLILVAFLTGGIGRASTASSKVLELTVEEAVEMGLKNSAEGKLIAYQREKAQSIYKEAMAGHSVQVFGELSAEAYDNTQVLPGENNDTYEAKLTAEKRTYLSRLKGAKALNDQVAESNLSIALGNAEGLEQALILKIIETYQEVTEAQTNLRLAKENYERSRRFHEEIIARSHVGLTDIVDEKGAEAGVSETLTQVHRGERVLVLAMTRLKRLIGVEEGVELKLTPTPNAVKEDLVLPKLLQSAKSQRADIRTAEENLKRTEDLLQLIKLSQQLGIEIKWEFDRDSLRAGVGLTNRNNRGEADNWQLLWDSSLVYTDLTQPKEDWGTLKLNFKYTFFDGGLVKERMRQAKLLRDQTAIELIKVQEDVALEVEKAYYDYLQQKEALANEEIQYAYHRTQWEASEAKMRAGLASVKDVLDAQTLMNQSAIDKERAVSGLYLAKMRLIKAMGRLKPSLGWTLE